LECQPLGLAVKRHQTKFADNLAKLTAKATKAAIACRYGVNGNGTATDYDTGLVWEQKADDGSVHDKDNMYILTIEIAGIPPNGTAFTDFLGTLNNCVDDGTDPLTGVIGGFAGHCDWRLPSIVELEGIVDLNATGCGSGSPCIRPDRLRPEGGRHRRLVGHDRQHPAGRRVVRGLQRWLRGQLHEERRRVLASLHLLRNPPTLGRRGPHCAATTSRSVKSPA